MNEALIWGASGGIGSALVKLLRENQWRVYGAARNASDIPLEADLSLSFDADYEHGFESTIMRVAQESSPINLMVYAVGDIAYDKLEDMGLNGWNATLRSNLTGAYMATTHSLNLLADNAHVVFIGAYLDHIRLPKMGAYVAAKAGLQELFTVFQKEHRKLKFVLVRPGATKTNFWNKLSLKLPSDAKDPQVIAQAILDFVNNGQSGLLDL